MKIKSDLHAGECSSTWYTGTVQDATGGGYRLDPGRQWTDAIL